MPTLREESVDLVVTDPPYLVRYRSRDGRRVPNDDNDAWLKPAFKEIARVLKPNSYCISFYGWNSVDRFMQAWREVGLTPIGHLVRTKSYASRKGYLQAKHECAYLLAKGKPARPMRPIPDVLPWRYSGNRLHPTQKPVEALRPLIESFSKPRDLVLDPFAGSGTTGIAARETSRRFLLIEKDGTYSQIAKDRLALKPSDATKCPLS